MAHIQGAKVLPPFFSTGYDSFKKINYVKPFLLQFAVEVVPDVELRGEGAEVNHHEEEGNLRL